MTVVGADDETIYSKSTSLQVSNFSLCANIKKIILNFLIDMAAGIRAHRHCYNFYSRYRLLFVEQKED